MQLAASSLDFRCRLLPSGQWCAGCELAGVNVLCLGCEGGDHNSLSQRSAIANNVPGPGYRGQKGSMKRYSLGALEIIDQADCAKTKT